jgi:hypothetical protein
MAVNYSATVKDNRMTQVLNAIDGDVGAGTIEICSAAYAAVLVTFTFSDPAGSVSSGVLTFSSMPKTANASNSGTATIARIKDNSGDIIVSGLSVGTSGTDIIISSTTITSGLGYSLTAAAITHAA